MHLVPCSTVEFSHLVMVGVVRDSRAAMLVGPCPFTFLHTPLDCRCLHNIAVSCPSITNCVQGHGWFVQRICKRYRFNRIRLCNLPRKRADPIKHFNAQQFSVRSLCHRLFGQLNTYIIGRRADCLPCINIVVSLGQIHVLSHVAWISLAIVQ